MSEEDLNYLVGSSEWEQLEELAESSDGFNIFSLLNNALRENSWSRLLAFFLRTNGNHGLNSRFVEAWFPLLNLGPAFSWSVGFSAETQCEWPTQEGRSLDILVRVFDKKGTLQFVLGVENKISAPELADQLSDYQIALAEDFRGVHSAIVFLTPDGRLPKTSAAHFECKCIEAEYSTVINAARTVIDRTNNRVSLILNDLASYAEKVFLKTDPMNAQAIALVRELYKQPKFRAALQFAWKHRPRTRDLIPSLEAQLGPVLREFIPEELWKIDRWRTDSEDPEQIKLVFESLRHPLFNFQVFYAVQSQDTLTRLGSRFSVVIAGWADKRNESGLAALHAFSPKLPQRRFTTFRDYTNWRVFWEGDSYELKDLGPVDVENLGAMIKEAIKTTFPSLKEAFATFQPSSKSN